MIKVNSLFVIAASIWDQWTLESSAAYLMLKSLSSGVGYHIKPNTDVEPSSLRAPYARHSMTSTEGVARAGQVKIGSL